MKTAKQGRQINLAAVLAQQKNRQSSRFITESNVSSSSKECELSNLNTNTTASLEASREVKNCLLNLAYIFRKRLVNSFRKLHMLSLESSSSLGSRQRPRHKKNFSQIQFVCCASIFDVMTIKVQKNMVRALFKIKSYVGIDDYCELDVMRRIRILSSKNVSSNFMPVEASSRPSNQSSECTFSFNMNQLFLERVQYLNTAMENYEDNLIRCAFSLIKFTAIRHAEMRMVKRVNRRKNEARHFNNAKNSVPVSPNASRYTSPIRMANNSPPRPNRITKNFQIQITPRHAEQNRSRSKGRQILNRMQQIIGQLDQQISKSKSPNIRRESGGLAQSVRLSHTRTNDNLASMTSRSHMRKKNPFLDGSSSEENSNYDDFSEVRRQEPRLQQKLQSKSSKNFLRNHKIDHYKQAHSSAITKDYASPQQSNMESQYIEAPQFERHPPKIMGYPQPVYQEFAPPPYPIYAPPMYPYYPPPPNQDGRFFYPPYNGYMPYQPYGHSYEQTRFSSMVSEDSLRKQNTKGKQSNKSLDNQSFGQQSYPQGFPNQPFGPQQYQSQQLGPQNFVQAFPAQQYQPQPYHQPFAQPYPFKYK